ncbi:MAG: hypothetical protein K2H46_07085 [Muribaculaceae bacterium]|nr:hypothetical protein [Muribaculaceae bacterium]
MTYIEYLKSAEKHLKGCMSLLSSYSEGQPFDAHVWLELYYVSGYILEGLTVYSAYKLYNWPQKEDIQLRYNREFTKNTGIDFYYNRKISENEIFPGRTKNSLSVQGHRFQPIVKQLLNPDPSFNDIPYLGDGTIDADVESLIEHWSPKVRYYYHGQQFQYPSLNYDLIKRLITTCNTIYSKHI